MADALRIAVSGLLAQQAGITTAGHNIANAAVEGYSRQRVDFGSRPGEFYNGGYFGAGVDIVSVGRLADEFMTRQMRTDSWIYNAADTLRFYADQVDAMLSDPSVSVSTRIDSFFAALQTGADDPTWTASRQVVLSEAGNLTDRFNSLYARLDEIGESINTQLSSLGTDVATLAESVARLNLKIEQAIGANGADQPNDLLDQRDEALRQLAELVDISTLRDGNSISVFLGKGQALVIGAIANDVVTIPDRFDPSRTQLGLVVGGVPRAVSDDVSGGKIGGLLDFRNRVLDRAFGEMGRMAMGIAADMNAQQALGMDLDGDLGEPLFNDLNDDLSRALRARAAADNDPASTGEVRVTIDDTSQLTTSAYQLDILAGGAWRLFRQSDSTVVASGAALADPLVSVDGFTLDLNVPAGNFVDGDSFLIEPTRRGALDFRRVMTRPEDLAFAQPVRAVQLAGNLGTGAIAVGETFDTSTALFTTTPRQLAPPLLIRFTGTGTFDVLDNSNPANPIALVPPLNGLAFTPGQNNVLFSTTPGDPDYFGFQVSLSGEPQPGDSFTIGYNTAGVSDNRNGLALARLQTADTLAGATASYQGAYASFTGFVGSETRQARIGADSAQAMLDQTKQARDSISGVNLDEEAADLVKFEQAYSASAQVVAVARSLMDTLLQVFL